MKARASNILHDQDHVFGSVDNLIESDDIWVFHLLHEFDLSFDGFSPVWVQKFVFFVNLHGDLPISGLMEAHTDHCVGPLAYLLANYVVFERAFVGEYHAIIIRVIAILWSLFHLFRLSRFDNLLGWHY